MKSATRIRCIASVIAATAAAASGAGFLDFLKRKPAAGQEAAPAVALATLSQEQLVGGLKEALGKGVQQAVATLGQPDAFLKDAKVKIPMPANLQKVEAALRQDKLADEFVTTMNRAAEQAVPEAAAAAIGFLSFSTARSGGSG